MDNRRRRDAGREQGMEANGLIGRLAAQSVVKDNVATPFRLGVKDGAGRDRDAEHLLQTKRLGAKLNLVVVPASAFTAFVFDGKRHIGPAAVAGMKLHKIGDANDTKAMTNEPQSASGAKGRLVMVTGGVNPAMIERPRRGMDIVAPQAL